MRTIVSSIGNSVPPRRSAEDRPMLTGIFDEERNADGGDEDDELGPIAKRTIREEFNEHADGGANDHCQHQHDRAAEI